MTAHRLLVSLRPVALCLALAACFAAGKARAASPAEPQIHFSTADDFLDEALAPPAQPSSQPAQPGPTIQPWTPGAAALPSLPAPRPGDTHRGSVRVIAGTPRFYPPPTVVRRPVDDFGSALAPPAPLPGPESLFPTFTPRAEPVTLGIQGTCLEMGVRVDAVHRGSAAERMGLEIGDVILSVNGQNVRHIAELRTALGSGAGQFLLVVRDVRTGNYVSALVPQ